ncbi:TonB-dependent receptor plug domain-containing protein [Parahaliea mediterranea]|uniref:TonB-dependent receptor n=1 Tax=Parahaliea mediterranea TaxID=651086 RepID=A0A939ILU9_9GAMM|nr:TonB-dependent receptor [Parahaliea mediterranea]MBN7796368.1 TonB-dependent receptor [Parahaliea mediterranea]
MPSKVLWNIPLSLAVICAAPAMAGEAAGLETTLVTGTYSPLAAEQLVSSVSVLDAGELAQLNKRNLGDVLRTVPGLLVEEQGGPGGLTVVSVRGGEPNFTQVLLDGVPLNDPTNSRGGSYDFGNIDIAGIERIEVVRGPQSVVYGSDALAGVINLISRDPGQAGAPTLRLAAGERGFRDYRLSAAGELDTLSAAVTLGRRESGEQVAGSTRDNDSANLRLAWTPGERHRVSAGYRYLDGERGAYPEQSGGPLLATTDALDTSDYTDETLSLAWDADWAGHWHSRVAASRFEHEESFVSPGVAPYAAVPPNAADTEFRRDLLSWVNTLVPAAGYRLNLGFDYRDEAGDSAGYLDYGFALPVNFELDRQTAGAFVDLHATPLESLVLQASVRRDEPDDYAGETTTRLGLRYQFHAGLALLANWGEAFKLPSFFALGHPLVGNPGLEPETGEGWDLGLQWRPSPALELGVTGFFNRYRNLVDFDPEAFVNVNRREVESRGSEWQLHWTPAETLSLHAQVTHTDLEVVGEDVELLGRPEWKAGAWLAWRLRPRWHSTLDYQWTGEAAAASLHSGATVVSELPDYHRLDWNLRWQARDNLGLELGVDNLLDEDYLTGVGFPAPGRTLRVAVTLGLGV